MSSSEMAAWAELRNAAAEILKFGQHEGPCTNDGSPDEPCETHMLHMEDRKARLFRALEATSGPVPGAGASWLSIGRGGTGPAVTRGAGPGGAGGSGHIAGSGGSGAAGYGCCGPGGRGD